MSVVDLFAFHLLCLFCVLLPSHYYLPHLLLSFHSFQEALENDDPHFLKKCFRRQKLVQGPSFD